MSSVRKMTPIQARKIKESLDKITARLVSDSAFRKDFIRNPRLVLMRHDLRVSPNTLRDVTLALKEFDRAMDRLTRITKEKFDYEYAMFGKSALRR